MENCCEFYDDQSEDGRDYGPEVTREDIEMALGPGWEVIEHNKTPSSATEASEDEASGELIIPKIDTWCGKELITIQERRRSLSIHTEDSEDMRRKCEEKHLVETEIDLMLNALEEELNNKSSGSIPESLQKPSQQDISKDEVSPDVDPDYDPQGILEPEERVLPRPQQPRPVPDSDNETDGDPDGDIPPDTTYGAEYETKECKDDELMHGLSTLLDTFVQKVDKHIFGDAAVADEVQEDEEAGDPHDINTLMPWHIDSTFEKRGVGNHYDG